MTIDVGFGDMHANALSIPGHVLLTLQVLLGYMLLGALVTRFAVLFSAGGPAADHLMHETQTSWQYFCRMFLKDINCFSDKNNLVSPLPEDSE